MIVWGFVLWTALRPAGVAGAEAESVATGPVVLGVDAAAKAITGVATAGGRRQFVDRGTAAPLYVIQLAEPQATVTAREASWTVARDGDALRIETEHAAPTGLRVVCRLWPDPASGVVLGRIALRSERPFRIDSVQFPVLSLRLPLDGTGADDAVLVPHCDGSIVQDPLKNGIDQNLPYPGGASLQMLAAYDRTAGVYLAGRDPGGHAVLLRASRQGKALEMALQHLPAQVPVTEWSLPYDVAVTTFAVDPSRAQGWETAADLYRAWAVRQPWCRATLSERVERGDVPRWLVEPSLFYAFSLLGRTAEGGAAERLALVPEQARRWRAAPDGPVTFMPMGWEKLDSWVTPDYFPPRGGAAGFSAMIRALHDDGHHAMVFLSGLNWTLHKRVRRPGGADLVIDQQADFERRGRASAVCDRGGAPILSGAPEQDVGQYARICPATPLAQEVLRDASRRCQQLGIDCVQVDQMVGGGSPPCFATDHGHPQGGGDWSARAVSALFEAIRRDGKTRDPKFAFSMEEPGELFIPYLDVYHARDHQQSRWPRSGKATLGVPLFTHVYHDYVLGYGGDTAHVSSTPSDLGLYHHGMNLVCGKAPAAAVWSSYFDPSTLDQAQQRLLRGHFALWRGAAREFLVFGRRIGSPALDVPTTPVSFPDVVPENHRTLNVPGVLHSLWQRPDGRQGRVYVCVARAPVTFTAAGETLTLAPGEVAFRPSR